MAVSGYAGDKAGCHAKRGADGKIACASFEKLNLTADQTSKLETWQADCMKEGCTEESKTKFLQRAEGILSKDQYAALKTECDKAHKAEKATS